MHRGLWTRDYRYGYGLTSEQHMGEMSYDGAGGFARYDLLTGDSTFHQLDEAYAPNEAFFVPTGDNEDEGYLLSYVYDRNQHHSELWVLDAQQMAQPPVARVPLPVRVPQGFHGVWVDDETLA